MASEARLCAQSAMFACQAFECGKVDDGLFQIGAMKYHMANLNRLQVPALQQWQLEKPDIKIKCELEEVKIPKCKVCGHSVVIQAG